MSKILVAAFICLAGIFAQAGSSNLCSQMTIQDGRPWPWGSEINMPWKNLSGVWEVSDGNCENLFLFKVGSDANGDKVVSITQYDPKSCKVIAQGLGYEENKYIYAQMARHGKSYNLTIHAFNPSSVNGSDRFAKGSLRMTMGNSGFVMALTLSPVGEWDMKSAFEITKASSSESMVCE